MKRRMFKLQKGKISICLCLMHCRHRLPNIIFRNFKNNKKETIDDKKKMFHTGSNLSVSKQPFTDIVKINIECGKTSFLEYFRQYNDVEVVTESVEK